MKPKIIKTFKQGDSVCIVLPSAFIDELKIGISEYLEISLKKDLMIIKKTNYRE
jgi:antitoxin component of MazEF toxin-antitoxin module